ncbi:hypothetical protein DRO42_07800 [Candidatus Bathyarchaeota archaeon]|nr:MAG: hypothetical protein DRO42_07800 [Candidatus Bathyarchaeota archaeon]
MTLDLFAFNLGYRLLYGMLTRSHGYTPYMLSLMSTAMTGAWAAAQIPLGRLVDRAGYRRFLIASQLLSCGILLGRHVTGDPRLLCRDPQRRRDPHQNLQGEDQLEPP